MATEPASKRRKVAAPKRAGATKASSKKAAAPSKKDVKECMDGITAWFPLTSDAKATFGALDNVETWKAYLKMRDLYPGMPLVVLEKDASGDEDDEDEGEDADAAEDEDTKENKPDPVVDDSPAEAAGKTAQAPQQADAPVATPADTAEAGPAEDASEVEAAAKEDADDAEASVSGPCPCMVVRASCAVLRKLNCTVTTASAKLLHASHPFHVS
jgi:hypothetical protein